MTVKKGPAMRPADTPAAGLLARVPDEQQREDARRLCAMMQEITGEPPTVWGTSIIGFGRYHYRYASGHQGDSALASFSPRRQHLAIYLVGEFGSRHQSALARLATAVAAYIGIFLWLCGLGAVMWLPVRDRRKKEKVACAAMAARARVRVEA